MEYRRLKHPKLLRLMSLALLLAACSCTFPSVSLTRLRLVAPKPAVVPCFPPCARLGDKGVDSSAAAEPPSTPASQSQTALKISPTAAEGLPPTTPTPRFAADLLVYQPALKPEFAADVGLITNGTRYDIQVILNPGSAPTLAGTERVVYTNDETVPLDNLAFRLYPNLPEFGGSMDVWDVTVDGGSMEPVFGAGRSALYVPLRPALESGAAVVVTLQFSATLPTDTESGYAVFTNVGGVYAMAGFYPTIPVYDSQGWSVEVSPSYGDVTFTDASFYRVQLTAPAGLIAVTSGQIVGTVDNGDGTRMWTAVGGPIRDFYIAMSADYGVVSEQVDGTRINCYYLPDQKEGARLALQYASAALRLFNSKFGIYPYAELDVAPTPTSAGGIEYPGVIVVSQGLYVEQGRYFELVVAHEVAHQWWYGLVGSDQLDEPWMDEALTNYCMYVYFQNTASAADAQLIRGEAFENAYRDLQEDHLDRAIGGPVAGFRDQSDYVAVVYGKGPLFFDAVRQRLGDDAFFAGLHTYLARYRYGIAYPEDLVGALEDASGQTIDDLYRTWVVGQSP